MEKYQFKALMWLNLADKYAKIASGAGWYEGAGWYFNVTDTTGKEATHCMAKSDGPTVVPQSGQLEALNQCGAEGWSVAAWMPEPPNGVVDKFLTKMIGAYVGDPSPYFILQRRIAD